MRHNVTIGAVEFYITRYPPFQALEILGDLQQKFGAPLLEAVGQRGASAAPSPPPNPLMASDGPETAAEGASGGGAFAAIILGLSKISASLNGRELAALAKRLLDPECVSVSLNGGEAVKLTPTMLQASGIGPDGIVELCVEVVKHNYAPFIERFAGRIGEALDRTQSRR